MRARARGGASESWAENPPATRPLFLRLVSRSHERSQAVVDLNVKDQQTLVCLKVQTDPPLLGLPLVVSSLLTQGLLPAFLILLSTCRKIASPFPL